MKTIENIKKVSLVFFILTGVAHFTSSIFIANSLYLKETLIINKIMDIPFLITGMIYAMASLRLGFSDHEKDHRKMDIALLVIIVLTLIGLILINLVLPDL